MVNYIFLALTAENCSFCRSMKASGLYGKIIESVKNIERVVPFEVVLEKMADAVPNNTPKAVNKLRVYFPAFFIITEESWQECYLNPNSELNIRGFNLNISGGKVTGQNDKDGNITHVNIERWINIIMTENIDNLNKNIHLNKGDPITCKGESCRTKYLYRT